MRFLHMLRITLLLLVGAILASRVYAQAIDTAVGDLKPEIITDAGTNVPDKAPAVEVSKDAVGIPVIEELMPVEAPKAVNPEASPAAGPEATTPVEEGKVEPVKDAPAVADVDPVKEVKPAVGIPMIEELLPAPTAAPAGKPAAPAEAAPLVSPAEVVPVAAPVVAAPVEAAVAPVDATAPDVATKNALEAAMKGASADDRSKISTAVSQQEEVRRKSREIEGRKAMEVADQAWKQGDYVAASESYKQALAKLPTVDRCIALRTRAVDRLPACDYEIVRALYKGGKDKEAVAQGEEFLKVRPDNPALKKLIAKISQKPPAPPEVEGKVQKDNSEVEKQMRLGREAMAKRDYAEARRRFESVLGLEPDHREAMRYLKVLGDREYSNRSVERDATARKMTADVRDTWNSKYKVIKGRPQNVSQVNTQGVSVIEEKMKKIIIDEVEFRQANMHDVVDFLNKRSRDCDKSTEEEAKKGVNIILNLNPGGTAVAAPAAPKADDPFGAPEGGKTGGALGVPEVTFSARYITLYNALKIITSVSGLKWRIDGDVVMIIPFDWDPATIEMRMYPVEPTFIERVKLTSQAMPATTTRVNAGDKIVMDAGGLEGAVGDLKASFEGMGMTFPKGSSITYNPGIGKVIVANTADNLLIFEKLLGELNVVPMQVEIEAKFVEVNETDLYEAGLEWLLTDNWEMLTKNNGNPYAPMTATPRIQMNENSADGGFTKGLRYMNMEDGKEVAVGGGRGTLGSIASIAGILTNPDLTAVLHALEQNGNADLLSAPKVTARSGEEALIKVVTEYIYPTSFEVQGGQIGNNTGANNNNANIIQETTVVPQDFATREVGVILNVLPEVSQDGNMINLTMKPQVVTEPVWYQYGSTVRRADGSEQVLNMPQPFFRVRAIETKISIYDGATVAMGGLITESVEKVNDKIPVLGDIPFLGALFRSKSEKSVKRNLLIFVTAKLVDPAGHLIRKQETDSDATAKTAFGAAPAR